MKQGWEPWEDQPAVKKKLADVDNFLHLTGIDIGMYIYIYVSRIRYLKFFLCSQKFYYQLLSEADMYSSQNR